MTQNNWRDEFDKLWEAHLMSDRPYFAHATALRKIRKFIEQVEANAKREAYENAISEIESQAYALRDIDQIEYDSETPSFIHQAATANLAVDSILAIKKKYLTPPIDEQE